MNQKRRIILFISFGLVFLLTGVFIFFIFFHSFHFLKNTRINGIDVGCKTVDEVTVLLNADKPDYSFVLHTAAGDTVFTDEMLDFDFYVSKGEVQAELNKQNPFDFMISWFADDNELDVRYNAAFDRDKLDSILDGLSLNTNRKKSVDAVINYAHGIPKIIPETVGNYLDLDLLYATVNDAIISLSPSVDVDNGDFYVQPKVVSSDLEAKQKALEKVLVRDIKIRAVSTDIPLDSFDVYGFSNIEDDVFVSYNETKVERYIRTFAEEHNSVDGQHIFKTSDGKVIKPSGGTYGYSIDVEKTSAAFFEKLSDLQFKGRIDVIYRETGYKDALSHSVFDKKHDGKLVGDDIGNTYIEISIDKQHMWLYQDGKKVVDTDVVTGNADGNRDTPTGVYYVYSMSSPATLVGDNYRTEVTYWMALTYSGVGIHDSSWRSGSEYGGTTYQGNGSHGCINTPPSVAEKIYKSISPGIPVVIY